MSDEWRQLSADVWTRMCSIADPPRFMYFLIVVVGIGGLGAWLAPDIDVFRANLASYAMGIAAAASVELILPEGSRALRMLSISLGTLAIAASLLYVKIGDNLVWLAASFAWLLWVLSSSSNVNIGSPSPDASTGGDPRNIEGDLSGFRTSSA